MTYKKVCFLYGLGTIGSILVLTSFWLLSAVFADTFDFVEFNAVIEDFYATMVWGGLCGLLYLLPYGKTSLLKGVVLSIFPALLYLFHHYSWVHVLMFKEFDFSYLTSDKSLVVFVVYAVVWGVFTADSFVRAGGEKL